MQRESDLAAAAVLQVQRDLIEKPSIPEDRVQRAQKAVEWHLTHGWKKTVAQEYFSVSHTVFDKLVAVYCLCSFFL